MLLTDVNTLVNCTAPHSSLDMKAFPWNLDILQTFLVILK